MVHFATAINFFLSDIEKNMKGKRIGKEYEGKNSHIKKRKACQKITGRTFSGERAEGRGSLYRLPPRCRPHCARSASTRRTGMAVRRSRRPQKGGGRARQVPQYPPAVETPFLEPSASSPARPASPARLAAQGVAGFRGPAQPGRARGVSLQPLRLAARKTQVLFRVLFHAVVLECLTGLTNCVIVVVVETASPDSSGVFCFGGDLRGEQAREAQTGLAKRY